MTLLIQPSFAKGEIGPELYGRVDTSMYDVALKTARNMIIHPYGGASNRPGQIFIGPCKSHEDGDRRLVSFQFKTTDTYELEFGDHYMRVLRNDAHVTETPFSLFNISIAAAAVVSTDAPHNFIDGDEVFLADTDGMPLLDGQRFLVQVTGAQTFIIKDQVTGAAVSTLGTGPMTNADASAARIYTLPTPYAASDLRVLKFTQSADVMTLTHASYTTQELQRHDHDDWVLTPLPIGPKIAYPNSGQASVNGVAGALTVLYKVTAVGGDGEESLAGTAVRNATGITSISKAVNAAVVTAAAHGLTTGDAVLITSTVTGSMPEINGKWSKVTVTGASSFTCNNINSTGFTTYSSGGAYRNAISDVIRGANTTVQIRGASSFITNGDMVVIQMNSGFNMQELQNIQGIADGVSASTFNIITVDSTNFSGPYNGGGQVFNTVIRITNSNATPNNTIFYSATADAVSFNIYKFAAGAFGSIGNTAAGSFVDSNIAPDLSTSPPEATNPFVGAGNQPGASDYYQQRRVFGGSLNRPDTSYYSGTGHPSNFNVSSPIQDDDAITVTLAARQVNEIRHFVALNDLIILTSGSEWKVNCGPDNFFGPSTIQQHPQSIWGSSHMQPLLIGSTIIFMEDNQQRCRSLGYDYQIDGYTGNLLNLLAPHLLEQNHLVDWAFCTAPDQRMYGVRDDGSLLTMTFDKDQDVIAWTHFDTQGSYEAVSSLKNPTGTPGVEDGLYFIVKRKINGHVVRYIEKAASRRIADVRDCFFVDAGLTFDNPLAVSSITLGTTTSITTAVDHNLTDGDAIDLSDFVWETTFDEFDNEISPDQLNNGRFYVIVTDDDKFNLVDKNGSAIDTSQFAAYVEGGNVRQAVMTITGLAHLKNTPVSVLSNGDVVSNLSVDGNGRINLPRAASRVHIGLKYISDMQTLSIEAPANSQTIQGKLKQISSLTVRFKQSRGLFYGSTSTSMTEMKQRDDEDWGEPTQLLTGDRAMTMDSEWNENGSIFLRQRYPLPMTILAIIPDLQASDY